jgi:tRNA pseudouridine55 synthase
VASDGLVVIDKPGGMTSHDVVARVRRLAHTRRVGHAGTLDPMATGVLIVGVERATRLLTYLVGTDKVYRATIRLGQTTVTDDAEGEVTASVAADRLTEAAVRSTLMSFVGAQEQVPSAVSAIKVNGVRSYARVRSGQEVTLAARPITIHALDVSAVTPGMAEDGTRVLDVAVEVACSSGTYVRAIARDLGRALAVGGHLTTLRRTAVGSFTIDQASTLEQLADMPDPVTLGLDEAAALVFTRRDADADEARVLSHGGPLAPAGLSEPYAVFGPDGRVIAIVAERDGKARAEVVLAPANAGANREGS